jgi:hypothetical protein
MEIRLVVLLCHSKPGGIDVVGVAPMLLLGCRLAEDLLQPVDDIFVDLFVFTSIYANLSWLRCKS